jgi:hypothetical protein
MLRFSRRIGSSTPSTPFTAESGTRTSRCIAMMRSPADSLRTISLPSRARVAMVSLPILEERRTHLHTGIHAERAAS